MEKKHLNVSPCWENIFLHLHQLLKEFRATKALAHARHFSFPFKAATCHWWWWGETKQRWTYKLLAPWNDVILPTASVTSAVYLFINPQRFVRLCGGCAKLQRRESNWRVTWWRSLQHHRQRHIMSSCSCDHLTNTALRLFQIRL